MGRGQRTPGGDVATAPAPTARASRSPAVPRPFENLSDDEVKRQYNEAFNGTDRKLERELEREMWRRPGGSAMYPGDEVGPLVVEAVDADRLRIITRLPDGGRKTLTLTQLVNLMSGQVRQFPTEPDKRRSPEPVNYGQNVPRPAPGPHPAHVPVDGRPESVALAAESKRIDDQRDHMSEIRMQTDIVEFERLYWQQAVDALKLAHEIQRAGGLDSEQGMWGARYLKMGPPEIAAQSEQDLRRVYEHIRQMREDGQSDEQIIALLEGEYDSPFGGPRS